MPRRTKPKGSKQQRKRVVPKVRPYRLPKITRQQRAARLAAILDNIHLSFRNLADWAYGEAHGPK